MDKIIKEIIEEIIKYDVLEFEYSDEEKEEDKKTKIEQYKNKQNIELAYTTDEDEENEFKVSLNLETLKVIYSVNNKIVKEDLFENLTEVLEFVSQMTFDDLVDDDNFPGFSKYNDIDI